MAATHPQAHGQRAIAFFDGQNLYRGAKDCFGYTYPNYDPKRLAERICADRGWISAEIHFYTGVPEATDDPFWNHFWTAKLDQMGRMRIVVYRRPLRYSNVVHILSNGNQVTQLKGREKGIDVRLALDMVRAAQQGESTVFLVFSQDQDLTEAVEEVKLIAHRQGTQIHIASAYPDSPTSPNSRGIDKTEWIKIDKALYDACIDPRDYRPKRKP